MPPALTSTLNTVRLYRQYLKGVKYFQAVAKLCLSVKSKENYPSAALDTLTFHANWFNFLDFVHKRFDSKDRLLTTSAVDNIHVYDGPIDSANYVQTLFRDPFWIQIWERLSESQQLSSKFGDDKDLWRMLSKRKNRDWSTGNTTAESRLCGYSYKACWASWRKRNILQLI